jgi:hypothetical protein
LLGVYTCPGGDRVRVLEMIRDHLQPHHWIFVGVIAPINPHVETPEIRARVQGTALAEQALEVGSEGR